MWSPKIEHRIDDPQILLRQIENFEGIALKFSQDIINDANVRILYQQNIKRVGAEIAQEVLNKKIPVHQASQLVSQMRNQIMEEMRAITSAQGRASTIKTKPAGLKYKDLLDKYSIRLFKNDYINLTPIQKQKIHYSIIESSSRAKVNVSSDMKKLNILAKVTILVTATVAVYTIIEADNKPKETIRQGVAIGGGIVGGMLGTALASSVCGPGTPICFVAIILAGGLAGGFLGSEINDTLDEEYEEFTKWMIN